MIKPFEPDTLPFKKIDWAKLIPLIGEANRSIAKYDSLIRAIVNPNVLLSPLTTKEAVLSSKIEGTQATLQEVLTYEASPDINNPKYNDIQEVLNYRKAINVAIEEMKIRPLSLNLIKMIHFELLNSVRGANKTPGEFRKIQNWIGSPNSQIESAYFIPPEPLKLLEYLSNFEKYIHYDESDKIVQLAIVHAQFEILHPFLDGNGRLGRILIPLFLFEKQLLGSPVFYMSEYLESNRREYYERLRSITSNNEWQEWIVFFLQAFIAQADNNIQKAESIFKLYENMKYRIHNLKFRDSFVILDALFTMPIFNSADFLNFTKLTRSSGLRVIRTLKDENIILQIKEGQPRTPAVYIFPELLTITEK